MTIDTTKLRELAQNTEMTAENRDDYPANYARFIAAANPATVLALLDEMERTQGSVAIASAALSAAERELKSLRAIESAARNLVKVKGRHHAEIAYQKLVEVLG